MALVLLKLTITPLVIGGASLASRRWGPLVGGWFIALPLTSGPVLFFLALDHGTAFAAGAAKASLAGCIPISGFALAYALTARAGGWPRALAAAVAGWLVPAVIVELAPDLPLGVVALLVVVTCVGVLRVLPRPSTLDRSEVAPAWDIAFRIIVVTTLVLGLTAAAQALGPRSSGLFATVPAIAAGITVFAHRRDGAEHAIGTLRGLIAGLFATAAFHTVAGSLLVPFGIPLAFVAAIAASLLAQGTALRTLRRAPFDAPLETPDGLPAL